MNTRAKGNAFEREIARDIVHAFRKLGITKADCYRTPLSGGHRQAREMDPGDLVISEKLASLFPFLVECKRDRRFELMHLFEVPRVRTRKKSWVEEKFLGQAVRQAETQNEKAPLLVVRRNKEPALVIISNRWRGKPNSGFASSFCEFESSRWMWENDNTWYVVRWDAFLKDCVRGAEGAKK